MIPNTESSQSPQNQPVTLTKGEYESLLARMSLLEEYVVIHGHIALIVKDLKTDFDKTKSAINIYMKAKNETDKEDQKVFEAYNIHLRSMTDSVKNLDKRFYTLANLVCKRLKIDFQSFIAEFNSIIDDINNGQRDIEKLIEDSKILPLPVIKGRRPRKKK
jgi:hypothetical protein